MHQRVASAAHQLQKSGVVSGNRILITTSLSVDFFAVAIAAFAIGKHVPEDTYVLLILCAN